MWHRDFPPDAREMWDVIAKALLIRIGAGVVITVGDLRAAADTQAEIELRDDGGVGFRVERN